MASDDFGIVEIIIESSTKHTMRVLIKITSFINGFISIRKACKGVESTKIIKENDP